MRLVPPLAVAGLLGALAAGPASAHESDSSFLRLRVLGDRIEGEWEIHQRDAGIVLGLGVEAADAVSPDWIRARTPALLALLAGRLELASGGERCALGFSDDVAFPPDEREYALVRFVARCPQPVASLRLDYGLLFELDDAHRGFFAVEDAHQTHVGVFTAERRQVEFDVRQLDRGQTFLDYAREGVWHIALGADHVLFLVALLLPAALERRSDGWQPRESFRGVARQVVGIVTAFTVAHSITLALAVVGAVRLPVRWVEAAIAASVFAAAWNNLRPFLGRRIWAVAFGFGLVHGLGFASALAQLGLPRQARGLALLAFNVGVEVGQLAIVAALLPLLYGARAARGYRTIAVSAGSLLIAWLASIWLIERAFGVDLIPLL
jgi:hypothetical protein